MSSLPKSWGCYVYGPANHYFIGFSPNCSLLLALLLLHELLELIKDLKLSELEGTLVQLPQFTSEKHCGYEKLWLFEGLPARIPV